MTILRGGWLAVAGVVLLGSGVGYSYSKKQSSTTAKPQSSTAPKKQTSTAAKPAVKQSGVVDAARLTSAGEKDPGDWLTYGRTYDEKRFSPLKQINDKNISQLKPAWQFELNVTRGQEGTPLVVDGVMYATTPYSETFALDARTGAKIWSYEPKVPKDWAVNSCCGPINRGVAFWNGKVYVGTVDGHLIALDAKTGKVVWNTFTFPSDEAYQANGTPVSQYTTDGEPRVVKGRVILGTSGGDKGIRGFISAYDAETGKMDWRFYTVPGDPTKPFENSAMEMASKTWGGQTGGGGAVWDSMAYDPDLDMLYFGVGNPNGKPTGDRLFTESVVAIRPETGEYVWHYQEVPNDVWDYDSIPQITLADIKIDGQVRKVLLHAPKNGFFYVIDRATGQLISGKPMSDTINWSREIDMKTGRPIENPVARNRIVDGKIFAPMPGTLGGHSWEAMSYSPLTGLIYVPILEAPREQNLTPDIEKEMAAADPNFLKLPDWKREDEVIAKELTHYGGHMAAWNPATNSEVWRADKKGTWLGGTVVTAGNLVFEGSSLGEFTAYQADTGKEVWSTQVQTPIIGAPITYEVGGEQYVAIMAGWGGSMGLTFGPVGVYGHIHKNLPRILTFKLNGKFTLPDVPQVTMPPLNPPKDTATVEQINQGRTSYAICARCHGARANSPGDVPDLRYSSFVYDRSLLDQVVKKGMLRFGGMPMFGPEVSDQTLDNIRFYIIHQANQQLEKEKALAAAK